MNNKVSIRNVIMFAGAYCAFIIGSGYATGQEIMQFFGSFGPNGFIGILISMFLFALLGGALMQKGYELQLKHHTQVFRYYCGKYLGIVLEWETVIFLFSVVSIMIAGTGAIASENFGLPAATGSIFMAVLCVLTVFLGLQKLADLVGAIGPVIIVFTLIIGVVTLVSFDGEWAKNADVLFDLRATKSWWFAQYSALDSAWFSGVLYATCMVFGSTPFFTALGSKAQSSKEAFMGGFVGGVVIMLASGIMMAAMLCFPEEVAKLQVPNIYLANQFTPALAWFFSIILLMGIYSTAAPMFWVVINKAEQFISNKTGKLVLTLVLAVVAYFGAQIGFGTLIGILYTLNGQIGIFFIIIVFAKVFFMKDKAVSKSK